MELVIKFKKEIFSLIFAGVFILVIVFLLAPDRSEQILNALTLFAVLLIGIPLLVVLFQYLNNDR